MITKEKYVITKVKAMAEGKAKDNELIKPLTLIYLVEQWEFDYEMEKLRHIKADKF